MVVAPALRDFYEYVVRNEGRLVRTGVDRLMAHLTPDDPQTVAWLSAQAEQLGERLLAADARVARGTAYTYSSRLRAAAKRYLARLQAPKEERNSAAPTSERSASRRSRAKGAHRSDLTPREQIADAYEALVRWPYLRRFLAGALVAAEQALMNEAPK